ncbi:permease [Cohnella sp. GbtcB17]|uniref:permease n=1 Tax=Cohnella sp. GbtcB17 TaxID=2824762 RepID=UPI001C310451|nr:permease [Cohnella sp. GbtcB17]
MTNAASKSRLALSAIFVLALLYFLTWGRHWPWPASLPHIGVDQWQSVKTVFVSLFLEALPFMLLGVLVSAMLQSFVSEAALARLIPRNPLLGVLCAGLLGVLLPVCECGMIPVVRRLLRKGMPAYIGMTYILAAPIVNPVTVLATYSAFRTAPEMALYRTVLGFAAAAAVGLLLSRARGKAAQPLRPDAASLHAAAAEHHHHEPHRSTSSRLLSFCSHAADEFFEMGKFLMLGAFLTASIQTFVSHKEMLALGGGAFGSHLFMMGFAYVISLCSTSDAFVAASFNGVFPAGALLAFLVYGPMVDFKNTLMLLSAFKARFVLRLLLLVTAVVLAASLLAGWLLESAAR